MVGAVHKYAMAVPNLHRTVDDAMDKKMPLDERHPQEVAKRIEEEGLGPRQQLS